MSTDTFDMAAEEHLFPTVDDNYDEFDTDIVDEDYCDYCERYGHTFRSCARRDDEPAPDAHLEAAYEALSEGDWD